AWASRTIKVAYPRYFPFSLRDSCKTLDHFRIELLAGALIKFFSHCCVRSTDAIDAITNHGIESVRNRKDSRVSVNLGALKAVRITFAIPSFMVLYHNQSRTFEKAKPSQNLRPKQRMSTHRSPFLG